MRYSQFVILSYADGSYKFIYQGYEVFLVGKPYRKRGVSRVVEACFSRLTSVSNFKPDAYEDCSLSYTSVHPAVKSVPAFAGK